MVYLGTRLNFPISSAMEQFILDAAESMWNKEGHFIWNFNWEVANAEFDTDNDDKQQEELSIDLNYLELDAEKWPVYFTEAYYSGDGRGPQRSDSSAGYGEFPSSYLPVIVDMRILEHLNHGAALNVPSLYEGPWFRSSTNPPSLPPNVPEPMGCSAFDPSWARHSYTDNLDIQHSFQRLEPNWLLV
jgi:hypothetical protein